jgi:hypothetical protein
VESYEAVYRQLLKRSNSWPSNAPAESLRRAATLADATTIAIPPTPTLHTHTHTHTEQTETHTETQPTPGDLRAQPSTDGGADFTCYIPRRSYRLCPSRLSRCFPLIYLRSSRLSISPREGGEPSISGP